MNPRPVLALLVLLSVLFAHVPPHSVAATNDWSRTARYGDYLSAQMKSLQKFGYGMYVAKLQAADGPVCSTFWLYSDAPAPGCMPEIAQMWRWNEFDFEFVPYTLATQNSYIQLDGSFPNPTVTYYGSELDLTNPHSQQITNTAVNWVQGRVMDDDTVFADMQRFYNRWMVDQNNTNMLISTNDFNYAGAIRTTGPGFMNGGHWNTPGSLPGWQRANVWKYPLTAVKPVPDTRLLRRMATVNWWRTPPGNQSVTVSLPGFATQTSSLVVKLDALEGSTAAQSMTAAAMNSETYVLPGSIDYQPCSNLHAYTIVWTPTRIAFYIDAGPDGTNIAGATPVEAFALSNYPSLSHSGAQAPQGKIPWADTTLSDTLGHVSINLANYVAFKAAVVTNTALTSEQEAGAGWSGYPPATNWAGADAFVRSVKYFPLSSAAVDGTRNSDFDFASTNAWLFDLGDGTWAATNFAANIGRFFGILYAQDFTREGVSNANLRDAKSPLAVTFEPNADGTLASDRKPLMKLACRPSEPTPQRNFFRLGMTMNTGIPIGAGNPFMFATITAGDTRIGVSGASTPLAFFAPPPGSNVLATIRLYLSTVYHGAFPSNAVPVSPNATATVWLKTEAAGAISWSVGDDPRGIVVAYQAANPHLITVQPGSALSRAARDSDFDGDGAHDLAVYDSRIGLWAVRLSGPMSDVATLTLGGPGCMPAQEDFDGDGQTDPTVYETSTGLWLVRLSTVGYALTGLPFGGPDRVPCAEDYDGDGRADPAVYQESTGEWRALLSASGYAEVAFILGGPGYQAVPDDYDGDGRSDPAVYAARAGGVWIGRLSASGYTQASLEFGGADEIPVVGDYDNDGRSDPALYNANSGQWRVMLSRQPGTVTVLPFGASGFVPVPGDYDGDGVESPALYHEASGTWLIMRSDLGYAVIQESFGGPGYRPVKPRH